MRAARDIVIDLFAGTCSWSLPWARRGYKVVAFDIYRHPSVPPEIELRLQDVLTVGGGEFKGRCRIVFASPMCDEYARWKMPWTRARNPPIPNPAQWDAAVRIAREADAPLILENVQSAQQFRGPARWHFGPFYLWGDIPALMPPFQPQFFRKKESYGSKEKAARAAIPSALAEHFCNVFAD